MACEVDLGSLIFMCFALYKMEPTDSEREALLARDNTKRREQLISGNKNDAIDGPRFQAHWPASEKSTKAQRCGPEAKTHSQPLQSPVRARLQPMALLRTGQQRLGVLRLMGTAGSLLPSPDQFFSDRFRIHQPIWPIFVKAPQIIKFVTLQSRQTDR